MNRRLNHIFTALMMVWLLIPLLGAATYFIKAGGLTPKATLIYFLGDAERFINPKSLSNTLNIQLPHLLAYGVVLFGIFHFWNMLVPRDKMPGGLFWIFGIIAGLSLNNWLASFLVIWLGEPWHYLKWFGVWFMVLGFIGLEVLLLRSALMGASKTTD